MTKSVPFEALKGLTCIDVKQNGDDEIRFFTADRRVFRMSHSQDCCENVYVESIVGDLSDLIGSPILLAEESTGEEDPQGEVSIKYRGDSQTWTFYKLATIKGYVDIRWFGSSNGYYSESVDFEEVTS